MNDDCWTEEKIENGILYILQIKRTVRSAKPIDKAVGVAEITHYGAYGQIKFLYKAHVWISMNPFRKDFMGFVRDLRTDEVLIAQSDTSECALDIAELEFTLPVPEMSELHEKYIGMLDERPYWVEL